jgi:hypothetical protein
MRREQQLSCGRTSDGRAAPLSPAVAAQRQQTLIAPRTTLQAGSGRQVGPPNNSSSKHHSSMLLSFCNKYSGAAADSATVHYAAVELKISDAKRRTLSARIGLRLL